MTSEKQLKPLEKQSWPWLVVCFIPFPIFLISLYIGVQDLKHPQIIKDDCQVTAAGMSAQPEKINAIRMYQQSDNPLNDVTFRCPRLGKLWLNDVDRDLVTFKKGQAAQVTRKNYRYFPPRWLVSIQTPNVSH